jgi:hypothetical protein
MLPEIPKLSSIGVIASFGVSHLLIDIAAKSIWANHGRCGHSCKTGHRRSVTGKTGAYTT